MSATLLKALFAELDRSRPGAEPVGAFARSLGQLRAETLPPAAQPIWRDLVTQLFKADPRKPLPETALAAMRSWPAARIRDLIDRLRRIEAILHDAENEKQNDEIRDGLQRHYL